MASSRWNSESGPPSPRAMATGSGADGPDDMGPPYEFARVCHVGTAPAWVPLQLPDMYPTIIDWVSDVWRELSEARTLQIALAINKMAHGQSVRLGAGLDAAIPTSPRPGASGWQVEDTVAATEAFHGCPVSRIKHILSAGLARTYGAGLQHIAGKYGMAVPFTYVSPDVSTAITYPQAMFADKSHWGGEIVTLDDTKPLRAVVKVLVNALQRRHRVKGRINSMAQRRNEQWLFDPKDVLATEVWIFAWRLPATGCIPIENPTAFLSTLHIDPKNMRRRLRRAAAEHIEPAEPRLMEVPKPEEFWTPPRAQTPEVKLAPEARREKTRAQQQAKRRRHRERKREEEAADAAVGEMDEDWRVYLSNTEEESSRRGGVTDGRPGPSQGDCSAGGDRRRGGLA